jgi:CRP-like cAMP-binding protein
VIKPQPTGSVSRNLTNGRLNNFTNGRAEGHTNGHLNGGTPVVDTLHQPPLPISATAQAARPRNRILATLPGDIWLRLAPHLGHQLLIQGRPVVEPGKTVDRVYFPNSGLISLVLDSKVGARVETGLVGREGLLGLPEALNNTPSMTRFMVQIAGTACWLPAPLVRAEFRRGGEFQDWLLRYMQWQTAQAVQCALCNRLHSVEERLARWLLCVCDRLGQDEVSVTHEAIAHMLGTRRSSVTVALGNFEQAGVLHCARGRLEVLDVEALKNTSCECHTALTAQREALRLDTVA